MARARTPSHSRRGARLRGESAHQPPAPGDDRTRSQNWLTVRGAAHNNLKNIDVAIPLGRFVCITGVSGSGKSSLVNDILRERLARDLNEIESARPGRHAGIDGLHHLDKVIDIDQSPIGRTPRSNPATYIKVFDQIRDLFASLPDSKVRGYPRGRFSFNVPTGEAGGGRCEACEGNGANRVEMDFLADVWVTCPVCEGRRFNHETLQIRFRGRSIHDVLEMDVQQALEHFDAIPRVRAMLATLHDVGLDYIKLGQASNTLSGGEAQRIKLARELVKRSTGRTLYLLDEPTTGLHFEDIRRLLAVLHGFVDAGNTVVVIEHNLDVIKTADWIIDLGPEGGDAGGLIVAEGTPEEVSRCEASYTGQALRAVLPECKLQNAECKTKGKSNVVTIARQDRQRRRDSRIAGSDRAKTLTSDHTAFSIQHSAFPPGITVVGAKEHNLKDITVHVPRGQMTVCSGVSGSGKTSFAMDTVYVEGQRRYVESLSAYARQFLGQFQKPKVDHVHGLSPAIAIEQKSATKSPRSTVGTVTEIYDYMRVLWARVGQPHCPKCAEAIGTQSSEEIVNKVLAAGEGAKLLLCAPIERSPGEDWAALLARCKSQGYLRARVDGALLEIEDSTRLDARRHHRVEIVVDRIVVRAAARKRIADSVEHALALGKGVIAVVKWQDDDRAGEAARYSQHFACDQCGESYDEITPHHFSFNARTGWCERCEGLGVQRGTSPDAILTDASRSILDGGVAGWEQAESRPMLAAMLRALADAIGFDADTPIAELKREHRHALLFGLGERWIAPAPAGQSGIPGLRFQWKGFFPAIDEATKNSWEYRKRLQDLVSDVDCQACAGGRIRPESRAVRLGGRSIIDVCAMPLSEAAEYFNKLRLDRRQARIAGELLHEIKSRLRFLLDVGLEYLTLGRAAPTLSGGESQRIRLASQIGSGLTGVLYVLDEPTIGLHPRDNARLVHALQKLRDLGNTLLMVEHDAEILRSADHILDFGPGAGERGGRVVAEGDVSRVKRNGESLTGRYLSGRDAIAVPSNRRPVGEFIESTTKGLKLSRDEAARPVLTIAGARQNNLRNIDASFPLGRFICVTGVSGSGKSSLVTDILHPALANRLHRANMSPGLHREIRGMVFVDKVINVDQQPIGVTPSSNPATYCGIFDLVREVYARMPDAKVRGFTANRFSFNRPGGRCDDCEGLGQICHQMHFLPDVWVPCETCGGTRYRRETLEVRYKGKNIADVLDMSITDALEHFANVPKIRRHLQTLEDVGLGYVKLGQSAPTLSGGEAQRVKLAAELGRPNTGRTIYILDEPTTGLHFDDVRKLLDVLHRLVDLGNTVVCIEHNLDVMKTADWILDLGPEAGEGGGRIVAEGPPECVAQVPASHTGRLLKDVLAAAPRRPRPVFDAKKAAEKSLAADAPRLVVEDMTSAVKMPWQRDGRRWHVYDRVSREGKPVRWQGEALACIIDHIEKHGKGSLLPTDWNDRARVEVCARAPDGLAQTAVPWLLHALTGGEWLLECYFKLPRGTFKQRALEKQLKLGTLDDRDDIQKYGNEPRVLVRERHNETDMLRLRVFDRKEIDTPGFRAFLKDAVAAYLAHVASLARAGAETEPWKTDGKAWHLSQRIIPATRPKKWKPMALTLFLGQVNKILPRAKTLWDRKVFVEIVGPGGGRIGKVITHQAEALRVDLHVPKGRFTPTQVEGLGFQQEFQRAGASGAELTFWFRTIEEVSIPQLKAVIEAARQGGT